jgi:hypothetical protein
MENTDQIDIGPAARAALRMGWGSGYLRRPRKPQAPPGTTTYFGGTIPTVASEPSEKDLGLYMEMMRDRADASG